MTPKLLTLNQVAESLGWSYWRVYRSRSDLGAKKHHGQWYVHEGALRAFVASFEQPQQPLPSVLYLVGPHDPTSSTSTSFLRQSGVGADAGFQCSQVNVDE